MAPRRLVVVGAQDAALQWLLSSLAATDGVELDDGDLQRVPQQAVERLAAVAVEPGDPATDLTVHLASGALLPRSHPARTAARLDGTFPNATIVVLLRNPVDRAVAAFARNMSTGRLRPDRTLAAYLRTVQPALDSFEIVRAGRYADVLVPYVARFGPRLTVLVEDRCRVAPGRELARALFSGGIKTLGNPQPIASDLRWDPAPAEEAVAWLTAYYAPHNRRLEDLLGIPLPEWTGVDYAGPALTQSMT